MRTPLTLLIFLTTLCTATENEGVKTLPLYAAIGSTVSFPGVKMNEYTFFDLKRSDGSLALTCHGECHVRDPYTQRGQVYGHNETFVLRDLRAEDSGIYEFSTNHTVKARIHLHVIAPVKVPVLKQEVRVNGSQYQIILICLTEGDGPLNFTFLWKGHEILHNEVTTDNSSSLFLDGWDPQTSGRFFCNVTNPVSFETSPIIELLPPAPVKVPVLKQELRVNGSQYEIILICRTEGDGPLNFTFLRNGHEILHNEVTTDTSSSLSLGVWDPQMSGRFSCNVTNPVSSKTSPSIELLPPAPVKVPVLKQELRVNGSQYEIILICRTEGDGPLNFTFLRNGHEILHNEVTTDTSSSLPLGVWDPQMSGRFSCNVTNPVSSKTSPSIELLPPASLIQKLMLLVVIAFLHHSFFVFCYLFIKKIKVALRKPSWEKIDYNDKGNQDFRKPSKVSKFFHRMGVSLEFFKEIGIMFICLSGAFISKWWSAGPGLFLLCRLIFFFIKYYKETDVKQCVEHICSYVMDISSMIAIPAYCIAICVMFSKHYCSPWEMLFVWLPVVSISCFLLLIAYFGIKRISVMAKGKKLFQMAKDQPEGQQLVKAPHGDLERAEDNQIPTCEDPLTGVVGNPNVDQETPKQHEVLSMEGPEDNMVPNPEEGQPPISEECKNRMRPAFGPNNENSDGTENPEGQHLLTLEMEMVLYKNRKANG